MTTLTTDRLTLRPLAMTDAETITGLVGNYEVSKNLARVPYPYALSDAHSFLEWTQGFDDKSLFVAVTEKHDPDQLIGIISYEYASEKDDAELGYWLAQPYWNRGFMREGVHAVVNHGFDASRLNLMVSCYFNDNPNSGKILRGVGFEEVGPCMHYSKAQGADVPVTTMRLSRDRWLQMKKTAQRRP